MLQPTSVFQPMPRVVQGTGELARNLPAEVARFSAKKILIVTDPGLIETGIPAMVGDLLSNEYQVSIYSDVESDPSVESVDLCAAFAKQNGFDLIVGLGGGSPIDTAKCASILVTNPGRTEDYLGIEKVANPGLPKILIPTTAGTGSEVTNVAVLSLKEAQTKKGIVSRYLMADCAILDAALTTGLPGKITAATGMDALTHAIEAYVSRFAQPLTDYFALEAIRRLGRSLRTAVHYGQDLRAREDVLVASLYAGLAFGSAATGMVHGLAMPLGGLYNIPHGIANAVLLPHVMRFNLVAATQRFADIAQALGEPIEGLSARVAADRAIAAVESLSQDIGIPRYLEELDVPRSGMDDIARDGMTNSRQVLPNPRHVTYEGLIGILEHAFRTPA
ncbi:iron-containing alcohol dehydrogenase [Pusillimonas sp. T7-7]|uniref:iron-containing alcohol dehydrogenase n=1 Tax=Pusillimonas sp. (strain T7-7) TaxID=1007105 RepID=UPI0002084F91|nr:iron-containing alcohol dehydrogenase [Pusillimonas sp. T7-7]AEC21818.1 iron-containing alcohol dehydrogenase [Pusillimonas sp. T7-7]